jgi:hypothetical protein
MPPEMSETSLAPFTESLEGVAPDVLVDVLFKAQRAKQTAERVLDLCKDASLRLGGIPDGKGKAWRAQEQQGRESVAVGELRKQLGPEAEKFIKRGAPFSVARWVKA